MSQALPQAKSAYNSKEIEEKWTKQWFALKVFELSIDPNKPNYSIALPPPNVTGNLHMGHALNGTLQDILIRWHRMQGYNVLWQPGTDHAGIATQMVVERQLKKEGKNRHEMGREAFIKRVWEWRNEYGNQILSQYRRLGVSFNWERMAFTMDSDYAKAIIKVFVTLFHEGYIYRGNRITNWCPRCLTSVSDLEVEHHETKGHLYCVKYPLADGRGELIVATTRPETMFGDVAIAVHPKDERYKSFIGKEVILPLTNRKIPVIADDYVDREFGTGALKITPAHDANDWEVGQRHKLPELTIIDQHGKLMANEFVPAQFHGKERFAVRKGISEELQATGALVEIRDYEHGVSHCERCHTVIEPLLSDQWYLRMQELAEPAIKVVEEERVVFIPARYSEMYLAWMRNIRDWCISRQLWWGHRIPVWTCIDCNYQQAYEETPQNCEKCGSKNLEQDPDVLDTWFSSALWPFATLGWPEQTKEMKNFYPTNVLSTAREIINLWVARMIFMSLKFAGTIPFKQVLIHPVIQTPDGNRMSKSKGNVIDPLDMIDKYGADANRFWFASFGVKGDQDVRFREERLEEYKRFANKLWNAGRFVIDQLGDHKLSFIEPDKLSLADSWILHKFNTLLIDLQTDLHNFDYHEASRNIYEFFWDHFCDWYLEIAKIQLLQNPEVATQTRAVLQTVFEGIIRALHPIMPFITEELWSRIPKSSLYSQLESVMFAPYPRGDERFLDDVADQDMTFLIRVIKAIRNIRQTYNVPASAEAEAIICCADENERLNLFNNQDYIKKLARLGSLRFEAKDALVQLPMAACESISSADIFIPLGNLIDIQKSKVKLDQRKDSIDKEFNKVKQILDNADFKMKAPPEKIESLELQLSDLEKQMSSVQSQLKVLEHA